LFILLLPTQFGKHFFLSFSYLFGLRVDYLAPTIYIIDILVLILTILNWKTITPLFKSKWTYLLILFGIINIYFSKIPLFSFYKYLRLIEFFIVFSIGKFFFKVFKEKTLLIGLFIIGLFELSLGILQIVKERSLNGVFYFFGERFFSLSTPGIAKASLLGKELLRPYGTFSHPNSLAGFFLLLYFFVLINKNFNKHIVFKFFSLLIFSLLILLSFSKTAILTFIIVNTIYIILKVKKVCRICDISKIITLIIIGIYFLQAKTDPLNIVKRSELINNSFQIIKNNIIFGSGLGSYLVDQSIFISKFSLFINQPVHNIFLLFIAETGMIGIITAIFLFRLTRINKLVLIWPLIFVVFLTGMFDHYWLTLIQNYLLIAFLFSYKFSRANLT